MLRDNWTWTSEGIGEKAVPGRPIRHLPSPDCKARQEVALVTQAVLSLYSCSVSSHHMTLQCFAVALGRAYVFRAQRFWVESGCHLLHVVLYNSLSAKYGLWMTSQRAAEVKYGKCPASAVQGASALRVSSVSVRFPICYSDIGWLTEPNLSQLILSGPLKHFSIKVSMEKKSTVFLYSKNNQLEIGIFKSQFHG